jgi:excisionase family DNA binding protein
MDPTRRRRPGRLPSEERPFLSVGEAARQYGISEMTLYRAIHAGEFPAVRIRGRIIVPRQAIEAITAAALDSGGMVDAEAWVPDDRPAPGWVGSA